MKLPQFTIRDLLLSTLLVALAIGGFQFAIRMAFAAPATDQIGFAHLMVGVWLASGTLFGTAIAIPLRKPLQGGIFGLFASLLLLLLPSFFRG